MCWTLSFSATNHEIDRWSARWLEPETRSDPVLPHTGPHEERWKEIGDGAGWKEEASWYQSGQGQSTNWSSIHPSVYRQRRPALFSRFLLPLPTSPSLTTISGRLEGGLQEEASRCLRHDSPHHHQQRSHQRKSTEKVDKRRDLHLYRLCPHIRQSLQRCVPASRHTRKLTSKYASAWRPYPSHAPS